MITIKCLTKVSCTRHNETAGLIVKDRRTVKILCKCKGYLNLRELRVMELGVKREVAHRGLIIIGERNTMRSRRS